jgi:HK97 family phage major capsid protein/HK97 family phage prohead protease
LSTTEYRAASWEASDAEKRIKGRAIVFDQRTVIYTDPETGLEYGEIIERRALDGADLTDVILRLEHKGAVLARTRNQSLRLTVGPQGLDVEADMDQTEEARRLYESVKNGLYDRMSFAFIVAPGGDSWDSDTHTRHVTQIERVLDVALVAFPAYEGTMVSARSAFEDYAQEDRKKHRAEEVRGLLAQADAILGEFDVEVDGIYPTRKEAARSSSIDDSAMDYAIRGEMAEIRASWSNSVGLDNIQAARENLQRIQILENELIDRAKQRKKIMDEVRAGYGRVIETPFTKTKARKEKTIMENIEIRAFQRFVADGSAKNLNTEERAALVLSGSGAVVPTEIFNKMIHDRKYSDLLYRATVLNVSTPGNIKIPVGSGITAAFKNEGEAVTPAGTLSALEIGGRELMGAVQYSAAVGAMATSEFTTFMSNQLSLAVTEALETDFVSNATKGLVNLAGVTEATAATLDVASLADALAKLPQQYARNAIVMGSASAVYKSIGTTNNGGAYAFNLETGAQGFMGREVVVNENVAETNLFILDPKEIYVRFSMAPIVEIDRSAGFLSAVNTMRALTVVDFAINPKAVVRVTIGG